MVAKWSDSEGLSKSENEEGQAYLCLTTKHHPHPYKLRWLYDKAENIVKRQCLVKFSVGSFNDQVLCDELDRDAMSHSLRQTMAI